MRIDRKFFIGYDSTQHEAYEVCRQSLIDVGFPANRIAALELPVLENAGLYWRDDAAQRSTEFTNSRFLVPYLSGYYGTSIFCDVDFLWRKDPNELFDLAEHTPQAAVYVVKHDIPADQLNSIKMDGRKQVWYPRKNWSSMMVFNNDHPDCLKLTPWAVNDMSASCLHRFDWSENVFAVTPRYNYLVGYGYNVQDPVAVHFTDGGPWMPGYENVEYAEEWRHVQQRTKR